MIEALASGLPIVAARSAASQEVVSEGENGLFYEANSREALVAAVRRLCSDDAFREALARGARAAAEERNWEASTRVLRGYYKQALSGR